jgi:Family of unknown function (DUF6519)
MKGDFSRSTFRKEKHYSSVRMQQGRVQVDADWNEQADITRRRIETETLDVIGSCGAPLHDAGFHVVTDVNELTAEEQGLEANQHPPDLAAGDLYISAGRYYLEGVQAENEAIVPFSTQPYLPGLRIENNRLGFDKTLAKLLESLSDREREGLAFDVSEEQGQYHGYLDVWQRHITFLEDSDIREKALGGPDTATRTQTVWQVKLKKAGQDASCDSFNVPQSTARLKAQTKPEEVSSDPCIVPESAGYRGLENQLYRVEIHRGGIAGEATFKWSKENGSVVAAWLGQDSANKHILTVSSTGRDTVLGFSTGDWVELLDDVRELWGLPGTMVQVEKAEGQILMVRLASATGTLEFADFQGHPKVHRWDGQKGSQAEPDKATTTVKEEEWLELEDGVQIFFEKDGLYRTGDYWLIPARTDNGETGAGDIEWPRDESKAPLFEPPLGILHHTCPLALLVWNGEAFADIHDCRHLFPPLSEVTQLLYVGGDGQEAAQGASLEHPLQVRVGIGEHPVIGTRVRFTLVSGTAALSVSEVETQAPDGIAECQVMALRSNARIEARLLGETGVGLEGQVVYFNANLTSGESEEAGLQVEKMTIADLELQNDRVYRPEALATGIQITCSGDLAQVSVQGKPVCFVTLELPYPLTDPDMSFWHFDNLIGYHTLTLAADVNSDNNVIYWTPRGSTQAWLENHLPVLFDLMARKEWGKRLLARLTVKGSVIWAKENPDLFLDGDSFGTEDNGLTSVRLPSGDGRRGGDLELWFWLSLEEPLPDRALPRRSSLKRRALKRTTPVKKGGI